MHRSKKRSDGRGSEPLAASGSSDICGLSDSVNTPGAILFQIFDPAPEARIYAAYTLSL